MSSACISSFASASASASASVFEFTPEQLEVLKRANEGFGLSPETTTNTTVVFVYSAPKVGSTSIVSSLRIFCSHFMDVVHLHDDDMARRLVKMTSDDGTVAVTICDLIRYNAHVLEKKVFVLDVYRTPIERKMSHFFEELATFHFNVSEEVVEKYTLDRIFRRFYSVFPHIANEDCFMERYGIDGQHLPSHFHESATILGAGAGTGADMPPVALQVTLDGICYVKLRLQDSSAWSDYLSTLFMCPIQMVMDNQTENKRAGIAELYKRFKEEMCIPLTWWREYIEADMYFQYYLSEPEKHAYREKWVGAIVEDEGFFEVYSAFTAEEYALYFRISCENMSRANIQPDHYLDEGCRCMACSVQRMKTATMIEQGIPVTERVTHDVAKREWIQRRVDALKELKETVGAVAAAPPSPSPASIAQSVVARIRRPVMLTMSGFMNR